MAFYFQQPQGNNQAMGLNFDDITDEEKQAIGADLIGIMLGNRPQMPMQQPQMQMGQLMGQRSPQPRQQRPSPMGATPRIPAGQGKAIKNLLQERAQKFTPDYRASQYQAPVAPMPMRQQPMMPQRPQMPQQQGLYQNLGRRQQAPQSPLYAFNPNQMYR